MINENNLDKSPILELINKMNLFGFYITSAKTGQGVIDAFNAIINEIYNKKILAAES